MGGDGGVIVFGVPLFFNNGDEVDQLWDRKELWKGDIRVSDFDSGNANNPYMVYIHSTYQTDEDLYTPFLIPTELDREKRTLILEYLSKHTYLKYNEKKIGWYFLKQEIY